MFRILVLIVLIISCFIALLHEGKWSRKKQLAVVLVPIATLFAFTGLFETLS